MIAENLMALLSFTRNKYKSHKISQNQSIFHFDVIVTACLVLAKMYIGGSRTMKTCGIFLL